MRATSTWRVVAAASAILFIDAVYATAADAPASEASVRELIEVAQTKKLLDNASTQIDAAMRSSMQAAFAGETLSAEQQRILDEMPPKMVKIFSDNLRWERLEPMFIDIYKRTFTQGEIDGMLAFYKTDAGKALILKMPLAMQNTMQAMQSQMAAIMPQIQQLQRETIEKLKAAKQK